MRALPYNFHIVYVPGKQIPMADAMSTLWECEVHFQKQGGNGGRRPYFFTNSCSQLHYRKLSTASRQTCNEPNQEEICKGATLPLLTKYIRDSWPKDQKKLPKELHSYWNYQDELSMEDGILLKSNRILIPYTTQMEMLDLIHEGHQEIKKCLLHSR